ncbi:MAG: hypothetical protein K5694_01875 [Bacilli bacterium]|nr:hypothetical protein [Bacilli bacterium]
MNKAKAKYFLLGGIAAAFIVASALSTIFPAGYLIGGDYEYLLTLLISFILLFWGITMIYRVQFKKQRNYIIALVLSFFFWIILRFMKWLPNIHYLSIYADYLYYLPTLAIPLLFFMMTMDTFYPDFRFKRIIYLVLIILACVLIVLVLTNEFHYLVYRNFKVTYGDDPHIEVIKSDYGPLHYVALGYVGFISLLVFLTFIIGSRKRLSFIQIFIVSLATALMVVYIVLFTVGLFGKTPLLRDFALCITILLSLILESLLDIGLIINNGRYQEKFSKILTDMCIYDENNLPIYSSQGFLDKNDENTKITIKEIGTYKVKIIEDLTSINALQKKLLKEAEEVKEANRNLEALIKITDEEVSINYRLSLIEEIEKSISKTKDEVLSLSSSLPDELDEKSKKSLGYIEMLLGYMKQKCMLLLKAKESLKIEKEAAVLLMDVISKDILSAGYEDVAVNISSDGSFPTSFISNVNDFIHEVAKAYCFTNSSMLITVSNKDFTCKINVFLENPPSKKIIFPIGKITSKVNEEGVYYLWESQHE